MTQFKGTVSRDFLLLVFFMTQFPPHPSVFHLDRFKFIQKFAEIFASQGAPPVSTIPAANCHRYQRHRWQICRRCRWQRWQIMATISGCRHLKMNLKAKIDICVYSTKGVQTKLLKFFCLKVFSICHQCRWHRWQILSCEYLREFSRKFETTLMV